MKVLGGVSHAETQWDNIEKARFVSLYPPVGKPRYEYPVRGVPAKYPVRVW